MCVPVAGNIYNFHHFCHYLGDLQIKTALKKCTEQFTLKQQLTSHAVVQGVSKRALQL
jgi:hypothetical protein